MYSIMNETLVLYTYLNHKFMLTQLAAGDSNLQITFVIFRHVTRHCVLDLCILILTLRWTKL